MKTSTLKPGLLVSLKTVLAGGVSYQRNELEPDHTADDGTRVAKWETTRVIDDADEYERAIVARGAARTAITKVCHASTFGLLCPTEREPQLVAAIAEARRIALEFNAQAGRTEVGVFVLVGRVASDDAEAVKAINAEVREMIADMERGIKFADPELIREAAGKARQIAGMLSDDVAGKVGEAIEQARKAARDITKRVIKGAELADKVVRELQTEKLDAARFAVLDLDAAESQPMTVDGLDLDFTAPEQVAA